MKNLNMKSLMIPVVLAISLTTAMPATFAQDGANHCKSEKSSCDASCYLGCHAGYLNLNETQKAQIQERIDRYHEATAKLRQQLRTLRQQSAATEDSAPLGEAAVRAAAQTRANLRVELEVAHARLMTELNALLTPEQKAKRAEQQRLHEERIRECGSRRTKY